MNHAKRIAVAAVAVALLAPSPVSAARPRASTFEDCHEHTAFFPIPSSQAATYLPAGFEPVAAPADNENLTNFYVTSITCGDPEAPQLELALTHLVVAPPADAGPVSNHYLLGLGVEGPGAAPFRKTTCTPAEGAAIEVTDEAVRLPLGPHAGVAATTVAADFLSARFTVSAERSSGWGSEDVRWFFGDGKRFFDTSSALLFWGIGSSSVAFLQPYLDLPPGAAGASKQAIGAYTFSAPGACRSVR